MPDISAASGVATIVLALIGLAGAVHQLTKNSSREAQAETIINTLLLFLLVIAVVAAPAWVFPVFAVNVVVNTGFFIFKSQVIRGDYVALVMNWTMLGVFFAQAIR